MPPPAPDHPGLANTSDDLHGWNSRQGQGCHVFLALAVLAGARVDWAGTRGMDEFERKAPLSRVVPGLAAALASAPLPDCHATKTECR
jgi:hypothetical protein